MRINISIEDLDFLLGSKGYCFVDEKTRAGSDTSLFEYSGGKLMFDGLFHRDCLVWYNNNHVLGIKFHNNTNGYVHLMDEKSFKDFFAKELRIIKLNKIV